MKNLKLCAKIMLVMILTIFFTSCIPRFTDPTDPNDESSSGGGVSIPIETDATRQEGYRKQWLINTENINSDNRYSGFADIWGDGKMALDFWFKDGNLWDAYYDVPSGYVLHKLLTDKDNDTVNKTTFIDGNTAIMFMTGSASPKLYGNLYIVRIAHNKIYRTKNGARGFGNLNTWDGKTIPKNALNSDNLVLMATSKVPDVDMPFDTTPEAQENYRKQWMANTKNITKVANYQTKDVDISGGGSWSVPVWFKNHDEMQYGGDNTIYKLVTDNVANKKAAFIDGNTAIMYYYDEWNFNGAHESLHVFQIKDNKIYRAKSHTGFAKIDDWQGETIPKSALDNLELFAEKK